MINRPLTWLICAVCVGAADSEPSMSQKAFNAVQSSNCEKFLAKHSSELSSFINTRQDGSGQTPLMMSVLMGQTDCVKSLLSYPEVDVTIPEKDGYDERLLMGDRKKEQNFTEIPFLPVSYIFVEDIFTCLLYKRHLNNRCLL